MRLRLRTPPIPKECSRYKGRTNHQGWWESNIIPLHQSPMLAITTLSRDFYADEAQHSKAQVRGTSVAGTEAVLFGKYPREICDEHVEQSG